VKARTIAPQHRTFVDAFGRSHWINQAANRLCNFRGSNPGGDVPTDPVLPENELRLRVLKRIDDGRLRCVLSTRIAAWQAK
jgi:hypothetical protein